MDKQNESNACERELKLLGDLDVMDFDSGRTLVGWIAPSLAEANNALLAEIILRRGDIESKKLAHFDRHSQLERMSLLFASVGVKLVVSKGGAA